MLKRNKKKFCRTKTRNRRVILFVNTSEGKKKTKTRNIFIYLKKNCTQVNTCLRANTSLIRVEFDGSILMLNDPSLFSSCARDENLFVFS